MKVYIIPDDNVPDLELIGEVDNNFLHLPKQTRKFTEFIKIHWIILFVLVQ